MGKKETYQQDLVTWFDAFLEGGDAKGMRDYLVAHSNLPGPRANLELAEAFGDALAGYPPQTRQRLWELCAGMTAVSAEEGPVNDPREFIPFCGTVGVGALGAASPEFFERALAALRRLADDPRWRVREAVRMGLQRLLAAREGETLDELEAWVPHASPLALRAVGAAVADPALLKDGETTQRALRMHRQVMARMVEMEARRSDDFKALRKALGYTLSLVAQAAPEPGFAFLRELAASEDRDVRWIVKENLRKSRLAKNFPEEVAAVRRRLEASTGARDH